MLTLEVARAEPLRADPRGRGERGGRSRRGSVFAVVGVLAASAAACASGGGQAPSEGETTSTVAAVAAPPADVVALVDGALTAEGRRLFYAARPQILDRAAFAVSCPNSDVALVVLGCYDKGRISILRVDRPELSRIMQVTAAHELLHAAYGALSARDRTGVDADILASYRTIGDAELRDLIQTYDRVEPMERLNELHSILPTTRRTLSAPLERYYTRYFVSRARLVDAYEGYKAPFDDLRRRAAGMRDEIVPLRARLDQMEHDLMSRRAALSVLDHQLADLKARRQVRSYNALIPEQNARSREFNGLVDQFNALVKAYNDKVAQANALALEQRELEQGLNAYPAAGRPGG